VHRSERTRDISSSGVCFLSPTDVNIGGRIEYVITLSGRTPAVRIRCLGKVVRSSLPQVADSTGFEVGVTMDRYQFVRDEDMEALQATG
jgi:hypothetical protein